VQDHRRVAGARGADDGGALRHVAEVKGGRGPAPGSGDSIHARRAWRLGLFQARRARSTSLGAGYIAARGRARRRGYGRFVATVQAPDAPEAADQIRRTSDPGLRRNAALNAAKAGNVALGLVRAGDYFAPRFGGTHRLWRRSGRVCLR
jgi:hypothetical protein